MYKEPAFSISYSVVIVEKFCTYGQMRRFTLPQVNDRSSEASTHGNLAVAYQAVQGHEAALRHYRAHLAIARELKDTAGEACALLNLANCLSSRGRFEEAVPYYEHYLMLSQELHDVEGEAKACHFLGYAHYCLGNHREAVRYYDQDLALAKDLQDKSGMGRAYCNLGLAHLALENLDTALECQKYYLGEICISDFSGLTVECYFTFNQLSCYLRNLIAYDLRVILICKIINLGF